jgi:hypothetical protein
MSNPIRWVRKTRGIPWKSRLRHHINAVRWMLDRCTGCGHRFAWKGDARFSFGNAGETYHEPCMAKITWRNKAIERMAVLSLICDVWEVTGEDVRSLMANRNIDPLGESKGWDLAWRVFYDLEREADQNHQQVSP